MKKIFYLGLISMVMSACDPSAMTTNRKEQKKELTSDSAIEAGLDEPEPLFVPANLLTREDAAKVLGEPVHLADSATTYNEGVLKYESTYTANKKESKTGNLGNLYFLIERYDEVESAIKKYAFIKTSNEDQGIKEIHDLGDEAYFHTDEKNFYFIMVRKGDKVFNMKVSKLTSKTSLDEFHEVAKHIAKAM